MTHLLFKFAIMMWLIEGIQVAGYAYTATFPVFITHGFYMFLWSLFLQKQILIRRENT